MRELKSSRIHATFIDHVISNRNRNKKTCVLAGLSTFENINTNNITPTSIVKWNAFLLLRGDEEITSQDVFKLCIKLTTDSTVQWFQYRILHRILPIKNYLKNKNY